MHAVTANFKMQGQKLEGFSILLCFGLRKQSPVMEEDDGKEGEKERPFPTTSTSRRVLFGGK